MPLYEYECDACSQRFEIIQKYSDPAPDACPRCGKGPVRRLLSSPAIQFKGSGWYVTDYAQKGKDGKSDSKGETVSGDKKSDTAKADTPAKTDTTTAAKSESSTTTNKPS
jgi:putative FmdB family regulatory protein